MKALTCSRAIKECERMSETMQWIGKNLSFGGLLRNTVSGVGTATNYTVQGVGYAASQFISDKSKKESFQESSQGLGKKIDSGLTKGGEVVGGIVNKAVNGTSLTIGNLSGSVAKVAGASEARIAQVQKVGTIAGAIGIGLVVGCGVASAALTLAAASGAVGATATTSGLAALGGGSLVSGGGGMTAGLAVTHSIAAGGVVSSVATLNESENESS
jgi:hypothetical protein